MTQGTIDHRLSNQWASRPNHERFLTLEDQLAAALRQEEAMLRPRVQFRGLQLAGINETDAATGLFTPGGTLVLRDGEQGGTAYAPTYHGFGMLASEAGMRATDLRKLPASIAAQALGYLLKQKGAYAGGKLHAFTRADGSQVGGLPAADLAALVGPDYGYIPNSKVIRALIRLNERSGGKWQIPYASYQDADPLRASTLYMGIGDLFNGLVYVGTVEINGRPIKIGLLCTNSCIKTRVCAFELFSYDTICDNRYIWGFRLMAKIRIRHTKFADFRFDTEFGGALDIAARAIRDGGALRLIEEKMRAAAATPILVDDKKRGKVRVETPADAVRWLTEHDYGMTRAEAAVTAWMTTERRGVPATVWDIAQVATFGNRDLGDADQRYEQDSLAGSWLSAVDSSPAVAVAVPALAS